jgi:hypothetical protein
MILTRFLASGSDMGRSFPIVFDDNGIANPTLDGILEPPRA